MAFAVVLEVLQVSCDVQRWCPTGGGHYSTVLDCAQSSHVPRLVFVS